MNVLILGFENVAEIDAVMQPIIEKSQCFLFNVVVAGKGISGEWADKVGAPKLWIKNDGDAEKMIWRLGETADYIVIKVTKDTPSWQSRILMNMQYDGKHGTVVRS